MPRNPQATAVADTVARPRWYSHGLNRLAYYRLASGCSGALPRALRLAAARVIGRVPSRWPTSERASVRRILARVPPIWVKPGEEVAAATMIGTLERAVRAHPTQWFNFFDVWSHPRAAA